jgi:hypothetical protein
MKLTDAARNALPSSDFVFPQKRKFPIENPSHARNALSRAGAQGGSIQSAVESAVHSKFPTIGKKKKGLGKIAKPTPDSNGDYDND